VSTLCGGRMRCSALSGSTVSPSALAKVECRAFRSRLAPIPVVPHASHGSDRRGASPSVILSAPVDVSLQRPARNDKFQDADCSGHMLLILNVLTQVLSPTRDFAHLVALGLVPMMLCYVTVKIVASGDLIHRHAHGRLLWRGPART